MSVQYLFNQGYDAGFTDGRKHEQEHRKVMGSEYNQLLQLRFNLARIAQELGYDNELKITGCTHAELIIKSIRETEGWLELSQLCLEAVETPSTT